MELVLLKLLLAHLLGDFFFQPNSWVADKEKKKLKSAKLYLHVAIHIILIFLVFFSFSYWKIALLVGIGHGLIDAVKIQFQTAKTKRKWFFIDQALHLVLIAGCWSIGYGKGLNFAIELTTQFWSVLLGALFLTYPTAVGIRIIIAKWIPEDKGSRDSNNSLQDAGMYIGILERLLIFLFVCTHHFEAVGFLLAAKSIFRFGDLKEANDIKLTEYVLIGTLLSFGIALVVALGVVSLQL